MSQLPQPFCEQKCGEGKEHHAALKWADRDILWPRVRHGFILDYYDRSMMSELTAFNVLVSTCYRIIYNYFVYF